MTARTSHPPAVVAGKRRRRALLGLEPIFEGGWIHKGKRAEQWDVEDELLAIALFGDVTIDLSQVKSAPADISISAWAILRDVDVTVPQGTHVELSGSGFPRQPGQ
jgi:predicted membrane protein